MILSQVANTNQEDPKQAQKDVVNGKTQAEVGSYPGPGGKR